LGGFGGDFGGLEVGGAKIDNMQREFSRLHRQNDAINTNYMAKAQNQPSSETPKGEWENWQEKLLGKLAGKTAKGWSGTGANRCCR